MCLSAWPPPPPSPLQEVLYLKSLYSALAHRKSHGVSGEVAWNWVRPHSVCPPRAMQFASLSSLGCSFALAESVSIVHLPTLFGYCGVFHILWPGTTWGRAGLRDSHQKHSPTSGAASARSTELECHCSRVIMRAKCTTTSWNCSICKGEQSVNDFTAAFPEKPCSKGLKRVKAKGTSVPVAVNMFCLTVTA